MAKVARYSGFQTVVFGGDESLPYSKFCLVVDILRKRIADEAPYFCDEEVKMSTTLLNMAEQLQMLFVSQDTPLYSTQNTLSVTSLANTLMLYHQQPLRLRELPVNDRENYMDLVQTMKSEQKTRSALWNEFVTAESFNRSVDYATNYSLSCILGLSPNVRKYLDNLATFNGMIGNRYNLMVTNIGDDNMVKVNYILEYIDKLEQWYNEKYPEMKDVRKGDYSSNFESYVMILDEIE